LIWFENDNGLNQDFHPENAQLIKKLYQDVGTPETTIRLGYGNTESRNNTIINDVYTQEVEEEKSLSLEELEVDMIKKALQKHKGKKKNAAKELGISERTLYRKINEYKIDL
jgi:transcriptional regulator with PAS, ATPase and Fis domain